MSHPKRQAEHNLEAYDLLKKHHKFLRDSDSEDQPSEQVRRTKEEERGQRLAKKYYGKLYKEFVLVDLSRFEKGQIGCRWRTEKQVMASKGEERCGEVRCKEKAVNVFEMNFGYVEEGEKKSALVKVSTCIECAFKLNYKKALRKIK